IKLEEKMFKAARIQAIKDIITERKQADVATLSSILGVSEVTIRKDLDELQDIGIIIKTHGGALYNEKFHDTEEINGVPYNKDKEYIGLIAAQMVKERNDIFLGPGGTCYYIAKALKEKRNIKVVTNNRLVLNVLAESPYVDVILTGGQFNSGINAMTGDMVHKALKDILLDKAFISVSGVHLKYGYMVSNEEELKIYKTIINIAKEVIIVADHTKFNTTSFLKLGPINIVNKIITNKNIPANYKTVFFEEGIQIFTSYDIKYSEKE
ncbi:MAG: DeoR/GlpR family DNA-binding transcription regulator, partial [Christensenellales bacterium]